MSSTDLGRIASNYYVKYETVEVFMNGLGGLKLEAFMTDDVILSLIASATEFNQVKVIYHIDTCCICNLITDDYLHNSLVVNITWFVFR